MEIAGWLIAWLLINTLIVAWRVLVVSAPSRAETDTAPAAGATLEPFRIVETPPVQVAHVQRELCSNVPNLK